jgi:outer membrane protein, heavy metal efflux system
MNAVVLTAWMGVSSAAVAAEVPACSARLTRDNLVPCALAASWIVRGEAHEVEAAEARQLAVSPLLPSNPVLSLLGATRSAPNGAVAHNWSANLAQEFEIAGQRGVRRDSARAEVEAYTQRALLSRREVAAQAWVAFFESVSARDEQRLAATLSSASASVAGVARARADQGLIAPIDADVADAAAVRVLQSKFAADRRLAAAQLELSVLVGRDPLLAPLAIDGELSPIAGVEADAARGLDEIAQRRPELRLLADQQRSLELRADAYRRSRIPNPTLSLFAQNDGFNERVLGLGVSLPIPLPGNVGRTFLGEIAEAEAFARRVDSERQRVARQLQLELLTARQSYASRVQELAAFSPERVARNEQDLRALSQEVEAGRLSVREAVVAQQALIEFLQAEVAARRALCLASVELARAAGVALESGAP